MAKTKEQKHAEAVNSMNDEIIRLKNLITDCQPLLDQLQEYEETNEKPRFKTGLLEVAMLSVDI